MCSACRKCTVLHPACKLKTIPGTREQVHSTTLGQDVRARKRCETREQKQRGNKNKKRNEGNKKRGSKNKRNKGTKSLNARRVMAESREGKGGRDDGAPALMRPG